MYGAIGEALNKPVMMLAKSTNKQDFQSFLMKVAEEVINRGSKPILVFDGATAHTAIDSQRLLAQYF